MENKIENENEPQPQQEPQEQHEEEKPSLKVIESTTTTTIIKDNQTKEVVKEEIKIEFEIKSQIKVEEKEEDQVNTTTNTIETTNTNTTTTELLTSFSENNKNKLELEQPILFEFLPTPSTRCIETPAEVKSKSPSSIKYKNKIINNLLIKKSGIILKLNSKKSIYIYQDSIIGCTKLINSEEEGNEGNSEYFKVTLFTCILKKKNLTIDKELRKRKLYNFQFKFLKDANEFINLINLNYLNTLPRGNPRNRKIRILINPKSGKKESDNIFKQYVEQLFQDSGINIKITITMEPEHAKKIGFKSNIYKYDTIVFISGDGLLHEFINGLLSREDFEDARMVPLALIPAGTGNGIACSIGLQDPMSAALAVIRGFTKPLDVCIIQQPNSNTTTTTTTSNDNNQVISANSTMASAASNITKWCSILSLTWGLVSDVDIESEKYRSLGDLRLIIGAAVRILNLRVYRGKVFYLPALPIEKSQMQLIPKCNFTCQVCDGKDSVQVIENLINNKQQQEEVKVKDEEVNSSSSSSVIKVPSNTSLSSTSATSNSQTTTSTTTTTTTPPTNKSPSNRSDINMSSNSINKSLDISIIPACKVPHNTNLLNESEDVLLSNGWKMIEGEFIGIVASTVSHLASDFISSPNAHLSDGLIDLIFINNRQKLSKASLLSILTDSATGDHLKSDLIEHHKVKSIILEPGNTKQGIIAIDGERIPYGRTSMENIRGLLNLICRSYH